MANTIGTITSKDGSFFIKHPDGTVVIAKVGDILKEGDVIIGSSSNSNSNSIKVALSDNSQEIQILGNSEQLFDITLLAGELIEDTVVEDKTVADLLSQSDNGVQEENPVQTAEATLTPEQIESQINQEAPAAGGDQGTEAIGLIPVRLEDRTAGETNIVTDLRDTVITTTTIDEVVDNRPLLVEEEVLPIDDVPTTGINPNVSLDDDTLSIDSIGNPLSVNFGQNGAGSVILSSITADSSFGFTSSVTGNIMTVIQNGVPVITITLNNVGGTYTYDVNQIAAINHPDGTTEDNINFSVNYVVTDVDGDTATGTFDIVVNDALPTAVDHTNALTPAEDTAVTVDIKGDVTAGADGVDWTDTTKVYVSTQPTKGTVVYNNDGTFTYTPTAGQEEKDSFTYTVTDKDGDTATATVNVTLAKDSTPTITTTDGAVDEAALIDGSIPSSNAETTTGTFTITTGNDSVSQVFVKTTDVTNGGTVQGTYGLLTVTNTNGAYTWSYTLDGNTTHTTQGANIDGIKDEFSVTVKDSDGDTSAADTLTVTIKDDVVTAVDHTNALTPAEDTAVTVDIKGDVTAGADGVDWTDTTKVYV
ncbi:Ig-like domain-containing protein, partial [Aliarcobacter cibarius]|uniref:Ig-like domain-containing protein n=2 Tax=Aliarcobacter cibarius TaxID=255507 RepID=UPI001275D69B